MYNSVNQLHKCYVINVYKCIQARKDLVSHNDCGTLFGIKISKLKHKR